MHVTVCRKRRNRDISDIAGIDHGDLAGLHCGSEYALRGNRSRRAQEVLHKEWRVEMRPGQAGIGDVPFGLGMPSPAA
jgi:hypothetical protein